MRAHPRRRPHGRAARTEGRARRASREPSDEPVLRFRNYQPKSEDLKGNEIAPPSVPSVEDQVGAAEVLHHDATQEPLLNLAPKKANWDLKRDIEPQARPPMTPRSSGHAAPHQSLSRCESGKRARKAAPYPAHPVA